MPAKGGACGMPAMPALPAAPASCCFCYYVSCEGNTPGLTYFGWSPGVSCPLPKNWLPPITFSGDSKGLHFFCEEV